MASTVKKSYGRGKKHELQAHGRKYMPNGLRLLFIAIRQGDSASPRSIEEFSKEFAPILESIQRKYKGEKVVKVPAFLERLENGRVKLLFWHLEAFAQYLKIPTGVMLLFSQLASHEHDNDGTVSALIEATRSAMTHAAKAVSVGDKIFTMQRDIGGQRSYSINYRELRSWKDHFPPPDSLFDWIKPSN